MRITNFDDFVRLIHGSIEYEIRGGTLKIKSYYTGNYVELNLDNVDPEMFDTLTQEDDGEADEEW